MGGVQTTTSPANSAYSFSGTFGTAVLTQTTWHFDFINGSDANNGLTASTALKTWGEYTNRTGAMPQIPQRVDYYIHGDMGPNDLLALVGLLTGGAQYVHFVPTAAQILHSGVLTGVVHYNNLTRVREEIQEAGFDFTPYVGAFVLVTTASGATNRMHILGTNGLGRAIVGYVGTPDPTDPYGGYISGTNLVGQSYQIIQRPKCYNVATTSYGGQYQPAGVQSLPLLIEFGDFSLCPFFSGLGLRESSCIIALNSCNITSQMIFDGCSPQGCLTKDGLSLTIGRVVATFHEFLRAQCWVEGSLEFFGGTFESCTDPVVFNTLTNDAPTGWIESHHAAYGIAIFNTTRWGVFHEGSTLLLEAGLWGSGNHGLVLAFSNGGRCLIDDDTLASQPFNVLTDVSPEMTLDGYTALPAVDPTTFVATASRATTFANWVTPVASGGHGRRLFDPTCPATCVMNTPP
jgi:hypothetical protein